MGGSVAKEGKMAATQAKISVLITGGSGFIGSFIVEAAINRDMDVWVAVRPTSSHRYLQDARIHLVELDLGNEDILQNQIHQHCREYGPWHYVVHAAGATKCRKTADYYHVNTEGTLRLARLLMAEKALINRFVFISSLSVYGPLHEHDHAPISATELPRPNTAYGRSKLLAEKGLADIRGLNYIILRPTGVYGPRERDYYLMARSICNHVDFSVGYRPQTITFIYVRDLVEAVFLAFSHGNSGDGFFLTDSCEYSSRIFSDLLQQSMGIRGVFHIKAPLFLLRIACAIGGFWGHLTGRVTTLNADKYKIMKQRNWRCDISPARNVLGFVPRYSLKAGVAETVSWYKKEKWI